MTTSKDRQATLVATRQRKMARSAHAYVRLDAPSWLWTGAVDLLASREGAYLEHCRRYATSKDP
jgi:uncharacterized protein (DUF2252 family)